MSEGIICLMYDKHAEFSCDNPTVQILMERTADELEIEVDEVADALRNRKRPSFGTEEGN